MLQVERDERRGVVDLVGDAGGELADRREAIVLDELAPRVDLGLHVAPDALDALDLASPIEDRVEHQPDGHASLVGGDEHDVGPRDLLARRGARDRHAQLGASDVVREGPREPVLVRLRERAAEHALPRLVDEGEPLAADRVPEDQHRQVVEERPVRGVDVPLTRGSVRRRRQEQLGWRRGRRWRRGLAQRGPWGC